MAKPRVTPEPVNAAVPCGMVLRQVAIMTLVGALVGLAGALAVAKGAQSILFQMTGADPAVLALSAVALALVALCAGFIPAHRASGLGSPLVNTAQVIP